MSAMGSYTSMVGRGLSTTYNAYDKADTTREIVEFIGTFVTTGTFSPTAAAQLALTLLPGNIPGADKIVGRVADAKGLLAERLGDFSGIAKRVAGVTDGIPSSTKLGANMREARGLTRTGGWTSFQAHHIIPKEFRSHAVIQRLNMYMDDASNGIFLPDPSKLPRPTTLGPGLSDHDDFHRMYNNFVSTKLNEIDVNLPVDQLERQVFELQQKLGVMCESGASLYHHPDFFERLYNTLQ